MNAIVLKIHTMTILPNAALIACLVSGNCTLAKVFQIKLQRQSYSHDDQTHKSCICKYYRYSKQWLQFCSQRICDPMLVVI